MNQEILKRLHENMFTLLYFQNRWGY